MQGRSHDLPIRDGPYTPTMGRKLKSPRHKQGAHIAQLRKAKGLTQAELAALIGVPQPNIALWEKSDKPPRSDVLPHMARIFGVKIEDLFVPVDRKPAPKRQPVGKVQRLFDQVTKLPRSQQHKVVEVLAALVHKFARKAG